MDTVSHRRGRPAGLKSSASSRSCSDLCVRTVAARRATVRPAMEGMDPDSAAAAAAPTSSCGRMESSSRRTSAERCSPRCGSVVVSGSLPSAAFCVAAAGNVPSAGDPGAGSAGGPEAPAAAASAAGPVSWAELSFFTDSFTDSPGVFAAPTVLPARGPAGAAGADVPAAAAGAGTTSTAAVRTSSRVGSAMSSTTTVTLSGAPASSVSSTSSSAHSPRSFVSRTVRSTTWPAT
ncbi:hypothetical protein SRABI128_05640 [Microbacterium sp. Bi128]|nr:hypothetical protein SRABI128_05640 [Microbacterium sp. Bi128]